LITSGNAALYVASGYQAYLLPSPIVIVADGQLVVRSNASGAARGSLGLAAFANVIWLLIGRFPALAFVLATAAWLTVTVLV
jgi:hypothetical protein